MAFSSLAVTAAACGTSAPDEPSRWTNANQRAAAVVGEWVREGRIPGAVVVVQARELSFSAAFGSAQAYAYPGVELEAPVPMAPETVLDLASITKVAATTLGLMLLVDRGRIDLDAPVSTYLPDFTGGGKEVITIEHLLTHRSGLAAWWPVYYHADNADDAYRWVRDHPLAGPVGVERRYSDLGFMVLGRVITVVGGRSLDRFLAEKIYEPLGLVATGFRPTPLRALGDDPASRPDEGSAGPVFAATSHGNPFERRMVHDPDFGYFIEIDPGSWSGWRHHTLVGEVNDGNANHAFRGVAGHAGLFSTAGEVAALVRLVLNGGSLRGQRIVSSEVVERFLEDTGGGQALGWQLPAYAPPGSFGHTGFTGTMALGIPELDVVVVLLTNRQNAGLGEDGRYPDVGPLQEAVVRELVGGR